MDTLYVINNIPDDVFYYIFSLLFCNTAKLYFSITCKKFHRITKDEVYNIFKNPQEYYSRISYCMGNKPLTKVEKIYLRMCHDGYTHLIDKSYIELEHKHNRISVVCPVMYGVINIVRLALHSSNKQKNNTKICAYAAMHGHLEVLKLLRSKGYNWDVDTCGNAAFNGHLEILKWARAEGKGKCEWNSKVCRFAALNGHVDILKWAISNGCEWDIHTCSFAVRNGHFEILKWVVENGCPWDFNTTDEAAGYGNLEMLKWCIDKGCRVSGNICAYAVEGGHFEILKWLKEKGYKMNPWCCAYAVEGGHFEILKWCIENGCPCDIFTKMEIEKSANPEIKEWYKTSNIRFTNI